MAGEWDWSPGNDCCCVYCSACGEDVDKTSMYELTLEGMANCDPILGQACDDCPDYDGLYIVYYDRVELLALNTKRCIYQHLFAEPTCDNGAFGTGEDERFNVQVVRLEFEYIGATDITTIRGIITTHEQKQDPFGMPGTLLPRVVKAHFTQSFEGPVSCEDVVDLVLPPTAGITPCGNNTACDWGNAVMTVNYLGTV